jgi:hypothetical protein
MSLHDNILPQGNQKNRMISTITMEHTYLVGDSPERGVDLKNFRNNQSKIIRNFSDKKQIVKLTKIIVKKS